MEQQGFWNAMRAGALLYRLELDKIKFWREGDDICFGPAWRLTPELEKWIRKHGRIIVALAADKPRNYQLKDLWAVQDKLGL